MFNNASILFLAKVANAQQSFLFGAANLALVFTTLLSLNSHQKSIFFLICVRRLATSAYKPARLGKSLLLGLSRRSGQTYTLVADQVASHPWVICVCS